MVVLQSEPKLKQYQLVFGFKNQKKYSLNFVFIWLLSSVSFIYCPPQRGEIENICPIFWILFAISAQTAQTPERAHTAPDYYILSSNEACTRGGVKHFMQH